jgi:muramoyltetrapeptide carboxypeptidase
LSAFEDEEIKAIICGRGGHGSIKLLDDIDYSVVKKNPKIFAGSSDITTLLIAFYKLSALKTFHSPMLLGEGKFNKKSFDDFLKTVNGKKQEILPKEDFKVLNKGRGMGILWGGNLATLVSLFGTYSGFYTPNDNVILFLEDLNEEPYKIDRMLTQIYRNKILARKIKGLVFGDFLGTDEKELVEILEAFSKKLNVPAIYGYNITHLKSNITVPLGKFVRFDTKDGILKFLG